MKVLIIEDEAMAANRLESMLLDVAPDITVLAKLGSIKESVKWLSVHSADLIFLDIQLSDGISFSIFEQVKVPIPIIFTTAYDQYSIKAFELNSISYLLKPVRKKDLTDSLVKFRNLKSAFTFNMDALIAELKGKPEYKKRFVIQIGNRIKMVESDEIAYFYAMDKSIFLKTFEGSSYPVELSLDKLEIILDPSCFFRINRKYLINLNSIESMIAWSRSRIKVKLKPEPENDMDTIVSIDRTFGFRNWLNQ